MKKSYLRLSPFGISSLRSLDVCPLINKLDPPTNASSNTT